MEFNVPKRSPSQLHYLIPLFTGHFKTELKTKTALRVLLESERFSSVLHTKQPKTIFVVERASECWASERASVRFICSSLIYRSESSRRNWSSCSASLSTRVSASFALTIGSCCQQLFVSNHTVSILKCLAVIFIALISIIHVILVFHMLNETTSL